MKVRRKSEVVEAIQFTGGNLAECLIFTGVSRESAEGCQAMALPLYVDSIGESLKVSVGEWVVQSADGSFFVCSADVFANYYEDVP